MQALELPRRARELLDREVRFLVELEQRGLAAAAPLDPRVDQRPQPGGRTAEPRQRTDEAPVEALGTPEVLGDTADGHRGGRRPGRTSGALALEQRRRDQAQLPGLGLVGRAFLGLKRVGDARGKVRVAPGLVGSLSPPPREQVVGLVAMGRSRPVRDEALAVTEKRIGFDALVVSLHGPEARFRGPRRQLVEELAGRLGPLRVVAVPVRARDHEPSASPGQRHVAGPAFVDQGLVPQSQIEGPEVPLEPRKDLGVAAKLEVERLRTLRGVLLDRDVGKEPAR